MIVRKIYCLTCNKQLMNKKLMKLHNLVHHRSSKPYQCYHCDKQFSTRRRLILHRASHSGHVPSVLASDLTTSALQSAGYNVNCPICNVVYMRRRPYLKHLEAHALDGYVVQYSDDMFSTQKSQRKPRHSSVMTESEKQQVGKWESKFRGGGRNLWEVLGRKS